ncbi:zinc ABC transporter ATP-binding protein AztA [Microbacterium sp. LMI1-1-1.1]|uniref:zinc ABC transporter ATP-binding protein AztA n=1 Tax=Microbacterium sp. LMI1-1-1.1 TaxID=3135223 RepID=UPI00346773BB
MPLRSALSTAAALRGIRVDYPGSTAVDGVDLDITAGALTVIVGPNGAGKTTLLEVLAGARTPTAGTVDASLATRAFVPQRSAVSDRLPLTVRDVVTVGAWGRVGPFRRLSADARTAVDRSLERLDIADLARRPFAALSGGQRQRALLAQGLAREADLLLLDEPTTGLDAASAELIRAAVTAELRRDATVVCVSHDDRLIADADRVVEMAEGRVVASGGETR